MKKAMIAVSVLLLSLVILASTGARIQMRNGDVIECEINMESISFITDYGEFKIPVSFVKEIVFPAPGNRVTTLNTVFPNETFGGFLLDEYISISLLGNPIRFHKDAINRINIYNDSQTITQELVQVYLKTGDQFYGEMLSTGVKIQTSYGEFNISTENIEGMEFEGEGNILTKIRLKNSSEMRGTIKDDFIVFRLLSGSELGISPGKIKSIVFLKKEEPVIIGEDPNQDDTPNPNASEAPVNQSLIDSASLPENMVLVERGSFTMGDVPRRGGTDSEDAHNVVLTYDFYIGKCEVTFDEYDAFCDATGSGKPSADGMGRGRKPVIMVSWWNAIAYCNWLSENDKIPKAYDNDGNLLDKYGKVTTDPSKAVGYRLPTEAEWEYAAEGGPNNDRYSLYGSDNADEVAWHSDNCGGETQVVGAKKSNSLGLFDMSGNVWEWCSDSFSKSMNSIRTNPYCIDFYKVLRGGSCFDSAWFLWIGDSETSNPFETYNDVGFRICRTATN